MTIIPAGFIKGLHVWRQEFYWAVADAGQAQFDWISSALGPLGVGNIEMWTNLQDHDPREIFDYTGIFIGGGNTYHLLKQLQMSGFMETICEFATGGGVLYGGSAGAIIMGRDIDTSGLWVRGPGKLQPLGTTPVLHFTPDATPRASQNWRCTAEMKTASPQARILLSCFFWRGSIRQSKSGRLLRQALQGEDGNNTIRLILVLDEVRVARRNGGI